MTIEQRIDWLKTQRESRALWDEEMWRLVEEQMTAAIEEQRESIARYFDLRASLSFSKDGRHQWEAAATDVRNKADTNPP